MAVGSTLFAFGGLNSVNKWRCWPSHLMEHTWKRGCGLRSWMMFPCSSYLCCPSLHSSTTSWIIRYCHFSQRMPPSRGGFCLSSDTTLHYWWVILIDGRRWVSTSLSTDTYFLPRRWLLLRNTWLSVSILLCLIAYAQWKLDNIWRLSQHCMLMTSCL